MPFFILWKVEKRLFLAFNMIPVAQITVKSMALYTTTSPGVFHNAACNFKNVTSQIRRKTFLIT